MLSAKDLLKQAQALNENEKHAEVIELLSDELLETYQNADLFAEKAMAFYRLKNKELCRLNVEKALRIVPTNAKANNYQGNLYFDINEYDKAKGCYNLAIKTDPGYKGPYSNLADVYFNLKEYEKAKEFYYKAITLDPNYINPYNGLGRTYQALKDYQKATEFYNKAIEVDPTDAIAYNNLGVAYYYLKDYQKAIEFYKKAIVINPNGKNSYNNLGLVYYVLKDEKNAKEFYEKAVTLDPDSKNPYYNLGLLYSEMKEYKKAIGFYHKYIDLTQNNPDYLTELAKSKIVEIKKLIASGEYKAISELVNKIKVLLLFEDNCITHYTSLSVTKILILKENSLFRLSEGAFLNDTSEGRELFDFLPPFFVPSDRINEADAKPFTSKPFVGSFVSQKKHDDLTLWRMYGKENKEEARGCAITIERETLLENLKNSLNPDKTNSLENTDEEFNFYRVAYREQDNKDHFIIPGAPAEEQALNGLMTELLNNVSDYLKKEIDSTELQNLIELLNRIAFLFKSFEYQYEHEVRLVVKGVGFEKNIDLSVDPPRVYIDLVGIRPLIERITLGPKVEKAEEWASAFYYSLDKEDLHPEILISHLPFK